ncbi:hypothetical protein OG204_17275 [Streptomyces sp. NBC_01387]|uniref:hypothetical protein n=1 Tax=unclassified Streptomyces TaxID=2593676 RepID=UPI00224D71D0|nr:MULTISPECIES: hypothetical protein [unclassified Streptomyces]MCX4549888.1 hypothetical protein [Streptomyces sp. NBC_01500]WSC21410.1 hypothetical protein OIE60_17930 [Streptomyces sp. NBC_01766]WSV55340.1 hypothetical protein OG282_17460 [Streptomyces sp. NBC_01014]
MITPWRRAVAYAATVTLASLAVQAVVGFLMLIASGHTFGDLADFYGADALLFALCAVIVLSVARLWLPALSQWRTAVLDATVYTVVLLVVSVATSLGDGFGEAVDYGFITLTLGLFTLQIPAALAACALSYGRLVPVAKIDRASMNAAK